MIIIVHSFSCLWVAIGKIQQNQGKDNWIDIAEITNAGWPSIYLQSFYFNTVTMITVGYGDYLPHSDLEIGVCIIIMIVSCGFFGYALNQIGDIFDSFYEFENKIKLNMNIINTYMNKKKITQALQTQLQGYLDYYVWRASSEETEKESIIIEQLSDILKEKLLLEANKIVLKDSPIFRNNFSQRLIQKTVSLISEYKSTPEENIILKDQNDDCPIYFIDSGKVEVFLKHQNKKLLDKYRTLVTLETGDHFGEYQFFTGQKNTIEIRAIEFTRLLIVKRSQFIELLTQFETDQEIFCYIKDNLLFHKRFEFIEKKCHSCGSFGHQIDSCKYVHYYPHINRLFCKYNYQFLQEKTPNDRSFRKPQAYNM